jgi:hypothetical protein
MVSFQPGLELCRGFFSAVVQPLLGEHFPALPYAAARIGSGSDVLGFDTAMSMDHDWGPILQLFLRDADRGLAPAIRERLGRELPQAYAGHAVAIGQPAATEGGPVRHRVTVTTVRDWVRDQLAWDIDQPFAAADWLSISSQILLETTAGAVYRDGVGELSALRKQLGYYPRDIWLYLLAAGWRRIAQEDHLMARAGLVDDELGAAVIGSRLSRDIMALAFLIERRYAPYAKWFGTAFGRLAGAAALTPALQGIAQARSWPARQAALVGACRQLARMHNGLGVTEPLDEQPAPFHDRPFLVIQADRFAEALVRAIADPTVAQLAARPLIGGIDQLSDNTDVRSNVALRPILRRLYEV